MNLHKVLKLASLYEAKLANSDLEIVKSIVKSTVETLWKAYPKKMEGLLYVSNFNLTDNTVIFDLNLDKNKSQEVTTNKAVRDNLIVTHLKDALAKQLDQDFDIGFVDKLV